MLPDTSAGYTGYTPTSKLTPEKTNSVLSQLGKQSLQALSDALWWLDTPGATIRSGIDYFQDGEWNNPLDADKRVSGEQILDQAGWKDDTTARWLAGAGLEIGTDPLTFLTGPMSSMTKAGAAAKKAGLLKDAAEVASRKLQAEALDQATRAAGAAGRAIDPATGLADDALDAAAATLPGRAKRTLADSGQNLRDYIDHSSRPLVGTREALQTTTLDDLLKHSPGSEDAVRTALGDGVNLNDVRGETLGRALGLGFGGSSTAFNPLSDDLGMGMARALDRTGEALRWGKVPLTQYSPGVQVHSLLNKAVGGQGDALSQAAATRIYSSAEEGRGRGGRESVDIADNLRTATIDPSVAARTGISRIDSPEAADAIDRYLEKVAATPNDIDFVENTPGVKAFVDGWESKRGTMLDDSAAAGLRSHALRHNYGLPYRPYRQDDVTSLTEAARPKGALYDTTTGDMIRRQKALQLPGGIDQLRWLSTNRDFVGLGKAFDEDTVARRLYDEINGIDFQGPTMPGQAMPPRQVGQYYQQRQGSLIENGPVLLRPNGAQGPALPGGSFGTAPEFSMAKARSLANYLNDLDVVKAADGSIASPPVFGMHPAEAIAGYIPGRREAESIAREVTNTIASQLVRQPARTVPGGKSVSARAAISKAGLKSRAVPGSSLRGGADANLRQMIADKINLAGGNTTADAIDLSQYSISKESLSHLTRMADHYASPQAVSDLEKGLEQYTKVFRAGVLSWPSRFSRDLTSGFISNSIEAGGPARALQGARAADQVLKGNYKAALPYIRSMPAYSTKKFQADEEAIKAYLTDIADSQLLGGVASLDRHGGDRTAEALTGMIPGWKKQSFTGSLPNDPNRSWGRALADAANPFGVKGVLGKTETTNPIFQWGERMGDWTDSINRLSGYNSLLRSGVAPKEAAARMMAAHVRYDNLSSFEKKLRAMFPFWAYNSRIGKWAIQSMMERPGGSLAQVYRMIDRAQKSDDDTYIPETMRLQAGFALPKELPFGLGEPSPGVRRFVKNIDVPGLSTLNLISSSKVGGKTSLNDSVVTTAQNIAEQMNPLTRTGLEFITQQDMHTKRKLGEAPSEIDTVVGALTGNEDFRLPTVVQSAADAILPGYGRYLNASRQIADPRVENVGSRLAQTAFNQVAPFRFGLVDKKRQEDDMIRQLDKELALTPEAKSFEITSIPKDKFDQLSPRMQEYYLVRRQKQLERQKAAREKAKAEKRASRFGA